MTSQHPKTVLLGGVFLALFVSFAADAADLAQVSARSGLNLRSKPSTHGARLRTLRSGEQVTILRTQGKWTLVRTQSGKQGWAFGKYLQAIPGDKPAVTRSAGNHRGMLAHIDPADAVPIRDVRSSTSPRGGSGRSAPASFGSGRGATPAATPAAAPAPRGGTVDRRNLSGLQPTFRAKVERVLARLQALGWKPYVAEGRRTTAQQREKVRRGVSRTMNSRHLTGNAADVVDRRYGWGGPARNQSFKFWQDLGRAARAEGLRWGGNWRGFKDVAHLQH